MLVRGLQLQSWARLIRDSQRSATRLPQHLFLCVADHYEPDWGNAAEDLRQQRVERWVRDYPRSVAGLADSLGRPPQHTFFFPLEEYRPRLLDRLAGLCHRGFGEVEVHLHHDHDTSEQLREKLEWFKQTLHRQHGLLHRDGRWEVRYGFIHGNWALDNSHPHGRWCGVNDELTILRETGCYADFTMPAAPDPAQTRTINSIYYAEDDPDRPKSHDVGLPARVGSRPPARGLLMIQGPLALDWQDRKAGLLPRLENADLHARRPPSARRLDLWRRAAVHVQGRPEWTFIKLHTHGAKPANADVLLGPPMRDLHQELARRARADQDFRYYYVTAREMADLVHAAEQGVVDPRSVLERTPRAAPACRPPASDERFGCRHATPA
ncbi:MAG: hypothetical protein KJ000_04055 [Pirellulaceae bacterium]|nr:hypothetical protein [Pirellulaceae bacterium]